jgi:DNA repair protein RecO (recombination protein O)
MRLREADRIVHLYTGTHGRIGAVVKGVRRTKSRFGGRLEPFFRVRLVLYKGRGDLDTITQAEAIEWYPRLRENHESLRSAGAACESVLRLFGEGDGNAGAYNLLCHELQLLDSQPDVAGPANMLAFRLKLLLAAGFVPELSACARCGEQLEGAATAGIAFSPAAGGITCAGCGPGEGFALDGAALEFMSTVLASPLREAPRATRPTIGQVDRAVTGTLEYHAHVRLRSVA